MKVKKVRTNLDSDLMGGSEFTNTPTSTLFSFGEYGLSIYDDVREINDHSNKLTNFIKPITLETLKLTEEESNIFEKKTNSVVLNLDNRDLRTFVRFGSSYEYLRVCVNNIIKKFPYSFYVGRSDNQTARNIEYNSTTNQTKFIIDRNCVLDNNTKLYIEDGFFIYVGSGDKIPIKDFYLNIVDNNYAIVSLELQKNGSLSIVVDGNPFNDETEFYMPYHIKPNKNRYNLSISKLSDYERYMLSNKKPNGGYDILLKEPNMLGNGAIGYVDRYVTWVSGDGYNIDIDTPRYDSFLESILLIGAKYDATKTDLVSRFLTPDSLKAYDSSDNGKMNKLLRLYGREFDEIRKFIDSLVYVNKITYDKVNNIPDILIKNLANTVGWDYFNILNEEELVDNLFCVGEDSETNNLPHEIDIELWRRIIINTNYLWKSKGTRDSIKAILLMVGIPDEFINITEYVYTVNGKINPNTVSLENVIFPNNSKPFDEDGYPKAPLESKDFYFQIAGNKDGGEEYMDVFRDAGFELTPIKDNKKSWVQDGNVIRKGYETPEYTQMDSKLVLNTKAVNISLDISQAIEKDVHNYIVNVDLPTSHSGYTKSISYVNISLGFSGAVNEFDLPVNYDDSDDIEVRFNGILLLEGTDYTIVNNKIKLPNGVNAFNIGNKRDVLQITYITRDVENEIEVKYVVREAIVDGNNTYIDLGSYLPSGDIQLTLNGIALTKEVDFVFDTDNNIIRIINPDVVLYLLKEPIVQIAFIDVENQETNKANLRIKNEYYRVTSQNTNKFYKNTNINKNVYKLNYKISSTNDVKVLVNGIMLEPHNDYSLNPENPYEIFLPSTIRYGHVVHVYYFIADEDNQKSMIDDVFGLGDVGEMSYLEFIEMVKTTLINVRNRKTMTDFKGGWYPNLTKLYEIYFKRSFLEDGTLKSNGYTFNILHPFLNKYNNIFEKFVDKLLPSTIILRGGGGLVIRNNVFTQQKHTYKRGVSLVKDKINWDSEHAQYLGDDGAMFKILQPKQPAPIDYYVKTKQGTFEIDKIVNTGGIGISNSELIMGYGMEYRKVTSSGKGEWIKTPTTPITTPLNDDSFTMDIPHETNMNLEPETTYDYRAYVETNDGQKIYGTFLTGTTLEIPIVEPFVIETIEDTLPLDQTIKTGGIIPNAVDGLTEYGVMYSVSQSGAGNPPNINTGSDWVITNSTINVVNNYAIGDVSGYGIEYRKYGTNPFTRVNGSGILNNLFNVQINNLDWNTKYQFRGFANNGFGENLGSVIDITTKKPENPSFELKSDLVGFKIDNGVESGEVYGYELSIGANLYIISEIKSGIPIYSNYYSLKYSLNGGSTWLSCGNMSGNVTHLQQTRQLNQNIIKVNFDSNQIGSLRFKLEGDYVDNNKYKSYAILNVTLKEVTITNQANKKITAIPECGISQTRNHFYINQNFSNTYYLSCVTV